ncbi:FLYWCH-type zinc finger-containing protein 1 isoform X2 [Octodon degus]|uniref:FLYWCH-type zinc finger-containing protein 1 n=1 Tax=Octodon degus TaxID=10160 RepID=A0A6P6E4K3_OCTDE|nr:FLYWCH-type zinc finger-containing protein 1 isoform X2 [Octodon degus]
MPLPEPGEQEGKSMKAAQEPSLGPSMGAAAAEFSNLVLLPSDQAGGQVGCDPSEVHCVLSLELIDPSTLTSTLLPAEEEEQQVQVVPPRMWSSGLKRSKLEPVSQPLEFLKTPFGGRLLVLESFLYKQEKAVGDKVYWKCRQHAELGCRGRAITRGTKATVMRDHCHPPDEEGLAARRQKEKLPNSALLESLGDSQGPAGGPVEELLKEVSPWLCPQGPEPAPQQVQSEPEPERQQVLQTLPLMSLPLKKRRTRGMGLPAGVEFLRTCYGGTFLVHQSFLYKREKTVGDKVYWTCRDHTLHSCRSRVITQGPKITVMRSHCHSPDKEALQLRRQQHKTMRPPRPRPARPGGCKDKLLQGVDSLIHHQGLQAPTLTRARPRKKAKVQASQQSPEEDQDIDPGPEFLRTPLGGSFLVYESFLYRREKAAGDKVYWTCRDQARMGCRSRAITQGQRVTVMRAHCHPPDVLGLETLRQRDKNPSPTHRESLGGPEFIRTPLGGSFLVYESFLYRREKATGDKVYWTCRDQARMGCRSRAITQGQHVMVMRRHCHPPDLGGLEALRQREHLPNLSQWEGPEPQQPLEFLRTSLGGRFLVYESFLYRKEKAAGEKVYWMCRDQARLGCRSRAITQGRRVMVMRSHCHLPDLAGLEALRQRERLPNPAQQEDSEKIKLLPEAQLYMETCSESQQICRNVEETSPDVEAQ